MFKKLTLSVFCVINFIALYAQTTVCTPNKLYQDSAVGVYPLPKTTARPDAGINIPACLGTAYSFVFTIKADSVPYSGLLIPVDSITVATSGAVKGMPGGLSYACNPPSCSFKKKVLGCVVIRGTPLDTDKIQNYPLVIAGKACVPILGCIDESFPSSSFPGDYSINVLAKGSAKCVTPTQEIQFISGIKVLPNPASESVQISFNTQKEGEYLFRVVNVLGASVIQNKINLVNGVNDMTLDVSKFTNGLYFYSLSKDNQTISEKFVVNH